MEEGEKWEEKEKRKKRRRYEVRFQPLLEHSGRRTKKIGMLQSSMFTPRLSTSEGKPPVATLVFKQVNTQDYLECVYPGRHRELAVTLATYEKTLSYPCKSVPQLILRQAPNPSFLAPSMQYQA